MSNELGRLVGVITDNFAVKNDAGDTVQLHVKYDFSTASDEDIKSWLCGNRRIAMQRPLRKLSAEEITNLNGVTILAQDAGKKVKSKEDQIQEFVNAFVGQGIDPEMARKLATAAVENPQLLTMKEG